MEVAELNMLVFGGMIGAFGISILLWLKWVEHRNQKHHNNP